MSFIKSSVFKRLAYYFKLVAIILSLSEIIPTCSHYAEKGLVYIIIIALFSCQLSFCTECTKLNIYSSCDVRSVSNTKYTFLMRLYIL